MVGLMLCDPAVRRLANDDVTRANRTDALERGFFAAASTAIIMSVIAALTATPVLVALRLVFLLGLFTAIFRFVSLEKQILV